MLPGLLAFKASLEMLNEAGIEKIGQCRVKKV